jgi:hypothetical protein
VLEEGEDAVDGLDGSRFAVEHVAGLEDEVGECGTGPGDLTTYLDAVLGRAYRDRRPS